MEYTTPEAIRKLFSIDIARKEYKSFKDSITTLEGKQPKRGVLVYDWRSPEPGNYYGKRIYREEHLPWLHNVVVVQGFFPKPKCIEQLLSDSDELRGIFSEVKSRIGNRNSLGKIVFDEKGLGSFYKVIDNPVNFKKEYLPNPFASLPQLSGLSVISALNHEADYMADLCDMLGVYYRKDIRSAYELAGVLKDNPHFSDSPELVRAVSMIEDKYLDAIRFSKLLDILN